MKTGLMFIDLRKKALSLEVEIGIMKGGNVVWVLADCRWWIEFAIEWWSEVNVHPAKYPGKRFWIVQPVYIWKKLFLSNLVNDQTGFEDARRGF